MTSKKPTPVQRSAIERALLGQERSGSGYAMLPSWIRRDVRGRIIANGWADNRWRITDAGRAAVGRGAND